jgi:stress responsive alpha/beta barrel protein
VIRHVVVFRFAGNVTEEQVEEIRAALLALRDRVPEIRDLQAGRDLGLRDGSADFAVAGLFDDEEGWRAYQFDEEHQRIIRELIEPVLVDRLAAQFTV